MKFVKRPYSERNGQEIEVRDSNGLRIGTVLIKITRQGNQTVQQAAEGIADALLTRGEL